MKDDNTVKKLVKVLAVLAGISIAVCLVSAMMYFHKDKDSVTELLDLGQTYLEDGKYEQAVASLEAALEIDAKEISDENPELQKNRDEVIGLLTDAYIAWADEEEAKGDAELAQEIRNKGFEKTGDKSLGLVLEDNDVYNYIGRWDELADALGLSVNSNTEIMDNSFETAEGFRASWRMDDISTFSMDNDGDKDVPILDIQIGDSSRMVEQKIKSIEVNYNAFGTYGEEIRAWSNTEWVKVFDEKAAAYYDLTIVYDGDAVSYLSFSAQKEEFFGMAIDVLKAQDKYGKISQYSWNAAYLHYIAKKEFFLDETVLEEWKYRLFYVNDDDIPELYLKKTDYENNLEDDVIAMVDEADVAEDEIGFAVGDISYMEKENMILASGNYGGNTQHNRLISIDGGAFEDVEIDDKKLQQFLTNEKARNIYSLPAYDESEIAEKLVKMGNDIQDETRSAGILLREGEVKKIDLNGGAEEEISCQYYAINNETGQLDIFVNDENVFHKTQSGEFGAPLSGSIQVIDANIKDPYKEIYYLFTGEDDEIMGMGFLHYNEKGKIKEYAVNMDDWDGEFYRSWDEIIQSNGAGTLYFNMDTPFMNSSFGQYLVEVEGRLDSKGFRIENKPTYSVIEDYLEGLGGYYELQSPITLYADYNGEDTKEKLSVGTKFRAISIHPIRSKRNGKGVYSVEADLYVQIETTDGKTGWVYFPKDGRTYDVNDILVITPGWA